MSAERTPRGRHVGTDAVPASSAARGDTIVHCDRGEHGAVDVTLAVRLGSHINSTLFLGCGLFCSSPIRQRRGTRLAEERGATRLDGLNLGQLEGGAAEAEGEVRGVEEDALGGLNGAELGARGAANAGLGAADGLLEGAMLLGVVAVGAEGGVPRGRGAAGVGGGEGVGEGARGRGGVRPGGVVDGGWRWRLEATAMDGGKQGAHKGWSGGQ